MPQNLENSSQDRRVRNDVAFKEEDQELFKELLEQEQDGESSPSEAGSIIKGYIVELTKDFVVVDVKLKSEGLIPLSEFRDHEELQIGEEIEVLVDEVENEEGQIVLSREKAARQRQWEYILLHCEEGSIVTGCIIRKVKGGLIVDIGMEAFLPGSQIDSRRIKNLEEYIGRTFDFKILKINAERKNVVISRRELMEVERMSKKKELLETLKIGDLRQGVVKNITDFGAFLDLDGIDGLLHITDMTWKRIRHPSEMLNVADILEVMILNVDREKGRVALGLKQKETNPWDAIEQRYPIGTKVEGRIVNLLPYGAFIEIEEGIEGLIHVSEMSWVHNITDPSKVVNKGDHVQAVVLGIQREEGKISLGMKQLTPNPWDLVDTKYSPGSRIKGEVIALTNYGAFIEIEPGIKGLLHVSDLSWTKRISHPSEILSKGDMVESVVLSIDKESRKITLGLKQVQGNPWEDVEKRFPVGQKVEGKVVKIDPQAFFISLGDELEALVRESDLKKKYESPDSYPKEGDTLEAWIFRLEPEHRKITLSLNKLTPEEKKRNSQKDPSTTAPSGSFSSTLGDLL